MLWQLRKLSTNEALNEAGPLPSNWGPVFGMENIQDQLGDLAWLGEAYADQGWVQVENEETTVSVSPAILAWEKAKDQLRQSDWAVLPDVSMTVAERQSWKDYRAELRDIRMQKGFPNSITWPTKPE
tara:strand:- start:368 stop:748 length:381 start_codon:yes stop_codon:yes gene_type:complete